MSAEKFVDWLSMKYKETRIIGDKKGHWLFGWGRTTPQILDMLEIPYSAVQGDFTASVVRCQETTEAYGKPVAMLFSGENVYGN